MLNHTYKNLKIDDFLELPETGYFTRNADESALSINSSILGDILFNINHWLLKNLLKYILILKIASKHETFMNKIS